MQSDSNNEIDSGVGDQSYYRDFGADNLKIHTKNALVSHLLFAVHIRGLSMNGRLVIYPAPPAILWEAPMLVVVFSEDGIFRRMVATSEMADAIHTAREGRGKVYSVPTDDARAAKAAIEIGEGTLIAIPAPLPSAEELAARQKKEREAHRKEAIEKKAAWQVVCGRVSEHNALIHANKSGVMKNRATGEILTTWVELPIRGPGSRRRRSNFVAQVLTSTDPEIRTRFQRAVKALSTKK
jgi:hypothetical protein